MPVLPLIDLLILMGTGSLMVGFVLKAIAVSIHYPAAILGFDAFDFALVAGLLLALALALAARTWVKLNEPLLMTMRRYGETGRQRVRELELAGEDEHDEAHAGLTAVRSHPSPASQAAGADRR